MGVAERHVGLLERHHNHSDRGLRAGRRFRQGMASTNPEILPNPFLAPQAPDQAWEGKAAPTPSY